MENIASLLGGAAATRFGAGGRFHALLIGALFGLGTLFQTLQYMGDAWYLPAGTAIPAPLRTLVSAPLALEMSLEKVRLACKCDFGQLASIGKGAVVAADVLVSS